MIHPYGQIIHLRQPISGRSEVPSSGCFTYKRFDFAHFLEHCPERVEEHFDIVYYLSQHILQKPVLEHSHTFGDARTALADLKTNPHSGVHMFSKVDGEKLPMGRVPREMFPGPLLSKWDTYVVAGGHGGLGLNVMQWLVDHGARHVTILTRRRCPPPAALKAMRALQQRGIGVGNAVCDITSGDSCLWTLQGIQRSSTVAGIIQAAGVVKVRCRFNRADIVTGN